MYGCLTPHYYIVVLSLVKRIVWADRVPANTQGGYHKYVFRYARFDSTGRQGRLPTSVVTPIIPTIFYWYKTRTVVLGCRTDERAQQPRRQQFVSQVYGAAAGELIRDTADDKKRTPPPQPRRTAKKKTAEKPMGRKRIKEIGRETGIRKDCCCRRPCCAHDDRAIFCRVVLSFFFFYPANVYRVTYTRVSHHIILLRRVFIRMYTHTHTYMCILYIGVYCTYITHRSHVAAAAASSVQWPLSR